MGESQWKELGTGWLNPQAPCQFDPWLEPRYPKDAASQSSESIYGQRSTSKLMEITNLFSSGQIPDDIRKVFFCARLLYVRCPRKAAGYLHYLSGVPRDTSPSLGCTPRSTLPISQMYPRDTSLISRVTGVPSGYAPYSCNSSAI